MVAIVIPYYKVNFFQECLDSLAKQTIKKFTPYSEEENFLFINAMNEWSEGNGLEPFIKYGKKYLEATKKLKK